MSEGAVVEDEVELKFQVPRGHIPPAPTELAHVGPTAELQLNALYFDTPDLRLAQIGATLRRRSGGGDAGWHLKTVAAGGDHRVELRLPITGARPPARLREALPEDLREAPLVPVARIVTVREETPLLDSTGRVSASYCLDRVWVTQPDDPPSGQAEAPSWVELEVELKGSDAALLPGLAEHLVRAGLRPAGYQSKLGQALEVLGKSMPPPGRPEQAAIRGYLWKQVGLLQALEEPVLRDEPDAIHKARVSVRRIRSTLRAFSALFDRQIRADLEPELKWLSGLLGSARDGEVLIARVGGESRGGSASLLRAVEEQRASDVEGLAAAMRSPRFEVLQDHLAEACVQIASPPQLVPGWGGAALAKQLGRVARQAARIVAVPIGVDTHALHEVRKSAKTVRYGYEALEPVFPLVRGMAETWKHATEALGELQDQAMLLSRLRAVPAAAEDCGPWAAQLEAGLGPLADSGISLLLEAITASVLGAANE